MIFDLYNRLLLDDFDNFQVDQDTVQPENLIFFRFQRNSQDHNYFLITNNLPLIEL